LSETVSRTTDALGNAGPACASSAPADGDEVSATATNTATGATSEFSRQVAVMTNPQEQPTRLATQAQGRPRVGPGCLEPRARLRAKAAGEASGCQWGHVDAGVLVHRLAVVLLWTRELGAKLGATFLSTGPAWPIRVRNTSAPGDTPRWDAASRDAVARERLKTPLLSDPACLPACLARRTPHGIHGSGLAATLRAFSLSSASGRDLVDGTIALTGSRITGSPKDSAADGLPRRGAEPEWRGTVGGQG
jgi:hypothetical protein